MGVSPDRPRSPAPVLPKSAMRPGNLEHVSIHRSISFAENGQDNPGPDSRPISRQSSGETPRRGKTKRSRTTYSIAHPPPSGSTRSKISLRPKVLMQLQKVAPNTRSVPAFEVLPAAAFALKVGRAITSLWPGKSSIGPEDLVVLQGQDYSGNNADTIEPKKWSSRHVVGLICRRKGEGKGSIPYTEIFLEDGCAWAVTAMPNGGYEFVSRSEHGLTSKARWVRKQASRSSDKSFIPNAITSEQGLEDRQFMFTKITPNMRQHPIVGSISRTKLDVYDHYTVPYMPRTDSTPSLGRPKRLLRHSSLSSFTSLEGVEGSVPIATEDSLRNLILVSGIWLAFREGWSSTFRFDEERDHSSCPSSPIGKSLHRRSPSNQTLSTSSESGAPQTCLAGNGSKLGVKDKLIRTGSKILHRSSTSSVSVSHGSIQCTDVALPPRRSTSTGVAFIKKVNGHHVTRTAAAGDPETPTSFHPSTMSLDTEYSGEFTSPVFYSTVPYSAAKPHSTLLIDTRLGSPQEALEDVVHDNKEENDVAEPAITRATDEIHESKIGDVRPTVQKEQQHAENSLYKNLKDIFDAFRRGSGLA
ncbi:MAG: hypothetical protein M1822_003519 [Bathelium mastoideum]|nr:MAG: hypothetical protein M1822_003519 [Bathelium mastoideum]